LIPIDENMKIGELQILIGEHIMLEPNKFIKTCIGFNEDIFIISVYNINFFSFRNLSIFLKNFLFYNQKFEFQIYLPEYTTVKLMKQLIFDRIHHLFNRNIGMEFEITEGFGFDTTIVAVIEKSKVIYVNIFDNEKEIIP
jgi:hypothetical protein